MEAKISFIKIIYDSRLLIRIKILGLVLKPGMQAVAKLTQSNRKVYSNRCCHENHKYMGRKKVMAYLKT
jgi:hypothetical protein